MPLWDQGAPRGSKGPGGLCTGKRASRKEHVPGLVDAHVIDHVIAAVKYIFL